MSGHDSGASRPVVLVTGASRGIGLATSERLAAAGWRVFATARKTSIADASGSRIVRRSAQQGDLSRVRADVRDTESLREGVTDILSLTGGRLDAVVANAGIAAVGMFEHTPTEVMTALMETNYFGVLNTVRETLPALRASRGRIVVISSDAAVYGTPGLSGYSASKFAPEGWAESVAHELRPLGICVSIIRPGAFRTDIWQSRVYLPESGPHRSLAETVAASWYAAADKAADPIDVAAAVERALTAKQPRLRYTVGSDAKQAAALRRLLPDSLLVRFVQRKTRRRRAT
jgi:NAD(P)-dependent dehydrogenase (short-subunit alcohol dehydrogenase family)